MIKAYNSIIQEFCAVQYVKALLLKKEDNGEIGVLRNITHIIIATTFESLIVYRNICRPCYVSRAYSCHVRVLSCYIC